MADETRTDFRTAMEAGMVIADLAAGKGDGNYAVIPPGATLIDLEKFLPAPRRLKQTVTFETLASFAEYVNRFKTDASTIFFSQKEATFTAVLDYHKAPEAPEWGAHVAVLKLQTTEEWDAWRGHNREQMDQTAFAEFIEEHCREIHEPPAATMLEIALNFEAKKDVSFTSGMRLENGQVSFNYNEVVGASTRAGMVEVPSKFQIFIAVFKGQMNDFVEARLRYRLRESRLVLWYDLIKPEKLIEHAVEDVVRQIKAQVEIEPLAGSANAAAAARS